MRLSHTGVPARSSSGRHCGHGSTEAPQPLGCRQALAPAPFSMSRAQSRGSGGVARGVDSAVSASTTAADAPDGDAGIPQAYVDLAHRLADAAADVTRRYFRHAPTQPIGPCTVCSSQTSAYMGAWHAAACEALLQENGAARWSSQLRCHQASFAQSTLLLSQQSVLVRC